MMRVLPPHIRLTRSGAIFRIIKGWLVDHDWPLATPSVEFGDGESAVTDELLQIGVVEIEAGLNRMRKGFASVGAMGP